MARTTNLPAHVKVRADLVDKFGFDYEYQAAYRTPSVEKRIQIRDEKHYTPSTQVTKYKVALEGGAKFPPPVFTQDGYLVDGNTTTAGYRKLKQLTMPALVLDVAWEGASDQDRQALRLMGAALNIQNGRGLDRGEVADSVLYVVSQDGDNYDTTRIAALLGVTSATVSGILAEKRASDRLERLGVEKNGALTGSHLKVLGGTYGQRLNDLPFGELARLVADSGMGSGEISGVIKKVKEAGSDDAEVMFIRKLRTSMTPRITEFRRTGHSRPVPAAQLRQCAGGTFMRYRDEPERLIEHGPDALPHLRMLEVMAEVAPELVRLQRRVLDEA